MAGFFDNKRQTSNALCNFNPSAGLPCPYLPALGEVVWRYNPNIIFRRDLATRSLGECVSNGWRVGDDRYHPQGWMSPPNYLDSADGINAKRRSHRKSLSLIFRANIFKDLHSTQFSPHTLKKTGLGDGYHFASSGIYSSCFGRTPVNICFV